ncbi:MAG: TerB family tellurite resistance protein [Verrucomicrobia bacterium]|nr:TerB family tellurite resistance protein [Verrucomicrobiota bacterium]
MTTSERESVAVIALSAAFCDGSKADSEREAIRALCENLGLNNASGLITRVLLKQVSLHETVGALTSPESRTLAYEMAVSIVEADGHRNDSEARFLSSLGALLKLPSAQAAQPLKIADDIADAAAPIRNTAILAGALELLPQSVATLGVLPLQTHLVYRIGRHYGYSLDAGHVKEFIGVLGLGLTSQAFEGLARKFLGGLVKKAGGGLAGGLAKAATGPAITFATTYAMGQLAQRYYAGGRTLSSLQLKESFQQLFGAARTQGERLLPEIQSRARGLNLSQLPGLIRGV